jgi:hypothetical protein
LATAIKNGNHCRRQRLKFFAAITHSASNFVTPLLIALKNFWQYLQQLQKLQKRQFSSLHHKKNEFF